MTSYAAPKNLLAPANQSKAKAAVAIALLSGVLAALVRWYFVTHAQVLQPLYRESGWGDAGDYYRYAWNLIHHGVFSPDVPSAANPRPDTFRDPAYPVFLALGMAVTDNYGRWYAVVLLTQALLGGVTVTCATLAVRDAIPTRLLAPYAATLVLWPHLVAIPAYVLSENLTALFCALTALALSEASQRRSPAYASAGGLALALASLTNAVLAPLFIPIALALGWKRLMPRQHILVFIVVAATPILAWGIRNSTIQGQFSPLFRAEINLVQGSWPTYHTASQLWERHDPAGMQTIDAINLEIAALHSDRVLGLELMGQRMGRAPGTYLAWYLGKPGLLWGWEIGLGAGGIYPYPTRNSPFITNPVMKAVEAVTFTFNGVLAMLALAGVIVVGAQRRPSTAMLTFALTALWVTVVYGVLQSDARYSIPYRTGEVALACAAVAAAVSWARRVRAVPQ